MMRTRILVIDDEEAFCEVLKFNLQKEGYEVDTADSAETALGLDLSLYNLMIVDIMMDRISGFDFAKRVRNNPATENTPIIFCSALNGEDDTVMGLNIGADDYITKPYSLRALSARVRTVLRRTSSTTPAEPEADESIAFLGLEVVPAKKMCIVDGEEVRLPRKEFEILLKLMSRPGHIFSREELIEEIWPEEVVVLNRVVDVNITRIRHKIGPYAKHIVSRSGYGYGFIE